MAEKSIIIIGAGMAGLSTGCYGQMNGYRTRIFEMHNQAGGLCTGWKRKGYTIGTSGWVTGSSPANNDYYQYWQELGAVKDWSILNYEEYARIEGKDGQVLTLYTDIDRLERHMHELAPEDSDIISGFIKALRAFTQFSMPTGKAPELWNFLDKMKMMFSLLPYMLGPNGKWMGMTIRDFAKQFKNPFMREAMSEGLPNAFFFEPDISLMVVLSTLAYLHLKSAGYPIGGAPRFISSIEQRYHDLGGEIQYKSPVAKILVEADPSSGGDRAVGVRLADGAEHRADIVISAADGHTTLFDMLEGKYLDDKIRGYYDSLPLFHPIFFISLGVNRTFEKKPSSIAGEIFPLNEPIDIAGRECGWLAPHIYHFDSSLAPEGKTLIRVMLPADYEYWSNLRKQDHERYKAEKQQIADQVIARLDKRFPGLADQVEMCDVATPATFERYTGNWQASWMGWLFTAKTMRMSISKTLPGLDSFYMVGTWVLNSGLSFAAVSGRHVTQVLCKKDNKPFVTTVP